MNRDSPWRSVAIALGVAGAYAACGAFSIHATGAAGHAVPMWPAAGVAVAGAALFGRAGLLGVAFGSFVVNTSLVPGSGGLADAPLAAGIALGAAAQAAVAARLLRHAGVDARELVGPREAILFLLLGGPVASLVNGLAGPGLLVAAGRVPADLWLSNAWTWWLGDTFGVVATAPVVAVLFEPWRHGAGRRRAQVAVPLLLAVGLCLLAQGLAVKADRGVVARIVERYASEHFSSLRRTLEVHVEPVQSLVGYYDGSERVEREEFRRFTHRALARLAGVHALEYAPVVRRSTLAAFEAAESEALGRPYAVRRATGPGALPAAASDGDWLAPVLMVEPFAPNEAALGFDLASDTVRRAALVAARDSGRAAATAPIQLVQATGPGYGVLVVVPVYRGGGVPADLAARRRQIEGFAVGVFSIGDVVATALAATSRRDGALQVAGAAPSLRLRDVTDLAAPAALTIQDGTWPPGERPWRHTFDFAGRRWEASILPRADVLAPDLLPVAPLVGAGALLLLSLLAVLLLTVTGHASATEEMVSRRTAELEQANEELHRSNEELERYAYVASHDLKEPLRVIVSFLDILELQLGDRLAPRERANFDRVRGAARRMDDLIRDLLAYSRVQSSERPFEPVPLDGLIDRALEDLGPTIADCAATVDRDPLPVVDGDPVLLSQLFGNLLGNALKFRVPDVAPAIAVRLADEGAHWRVEIHDNGVGVPPDKAARIFELFARLHGRSEYPGTGIGLAICKKVVQRHGGSIGVDDSPLGGACFQVLLPKRPDAPDVS